MIHGTWPVTTLTSLLLTRAETKARVYSGIGGAHRYPLAKLKCLSEKRVRDMNARLGGEPGGGRAENNERVGPPGLEFAAVC